MARLSKRRLLLACLFIVALGLRLAHAGDESLGVDEAFGLYVGSLPWHGFWSMIHGDSHPPLFYLLLSGWERFAHRDFALRLPSILLGLGTITAALSFLRRGTAPSPVASLMAAALLTTSSWGAIRDIEVRQYPLLAFLIWMAMDAFASAIADEPPSALPWYRNPWGRYGLFTALSLYTHYGAFLMLPVPWVVLLTFAPERRRRLLRSLGMVQVVVCVSFLPWLPLMMYQLGHQAKEAAGLINLEQSWPFAEWLRICVLGPTGFIRMGPAVGLLVALGLAVLCALGARGWPQPVGTILLASVLVPVVEAMVILQSRHLLVLTAKHGYFLAPALLMLAAGALARLPRFLAATGLALLVVMNLVTWFGTYHDAAAHNPPWREIVGRIDALASPGDAVLLEPTYQAMAYAHYAALSLPLYSPPLEEIESPSRMRDLHVCCRRVWVIQTYRSIYDPQGKLLATFDQSWRREQTWVYPNAALFDWITVVLYGPR